MSTTIQLGSVVWAPTHGGLWPAVVHRIDSAYCSVRFLGDLPFCNSEVPHVLLSGLMNFEQNLQIACVANRKGLCIACATAQSAGIPEQHAFFSTNLYKDFLALMESNQVKRTKNKTHFLPLPDNPSEKLREAHKHLKAMDAALRARIAQEEDVRNKIVTLKLQKLAAQCRSLSIEAEVNQVQVAAKKGEDKIDALKILREAALSHYGTHHPQTSSKSMAEDLQRAKGETAQWKRQFEAVQKELLSNKKRRKTN